LIVVVAFPPGLGVACLSERGTAGNALRLPGVQSMRSAMRPTVQRPGGRWTPLTRDLVEWLAASQRPRLRSQGDVSGVPASVKAKLRPVFPGPATPPLGMDATELLPSAGPSTAGVTGCAVEESAQADANKRTISQRQRTRSIPLMTGTSADLPVQGRRRSRVTAYPGDPRAWPRTGRASTHGRLDRLIGSISIVSLLSSTTRTSGTRILSTGAKIVQESRPERQSHQASPGALVSGQFATDGRSGMPVRAMRPVSLELDVCAA
jgi:hypothetical protein